MTIRGLSLRGAASALALAVGALARRPVQAQHRLHGDERLRLGDGRAR